MNCGITLSSVPDDSPLPPNAPPCKRCRGCNVDATITPFVIHWLCADCGQMWVSQTQASSTFDRQRAQAYLIREWQRLWADFRTLQHDFQSLRNRKLPRGVWDAHRAKLRRHRALLANHLLAWRWTRLPPAKSRLRGRHASPVVGPMPQDFRGIEDGLGVR